MNIDSINNADSSRMTGDKYAKKSSREAKARSEPSQKSDRIEISDEAKLAKLLDSKEIQEKIKSGFYDNAEVLREVAKKLSTEIPVRK